MKRDGAIRALLGLRTVSDPNDLYKEMLLTSIRPSSRSCRTFPLPGNSADSMGGQAIETRLFLSDRNVR